MPKFRNGLVVEVPATSFGLGRSSTSGKRLAYTTSPLFNGSYSTDDAVLQRFMFSPETSGPITKREINDGGHSFGVIDRDYQSAPNLAEVEIGGGGKPGSPFAPNLGVPGEGNGLNPAAIPESGVALTEELRSRSPGAFIGSSMTSPHSTVASVTDPGKRALGVGSGNSFRVRIS